MKRKVLFPEMLDALTLVFFSEGEGEMLLIKL